MRTFSVQQLEFGVEGSFRFGFGVQVFGIHVLGLAAPQQAS